MRHPLRRIEVPVRPPPTPEAFLRDLGGPAALRVPGRDRSRTRAVATLLHGNEPSGLRAVHALLRDGFTPAVDALFLIASVEAALSPPGFARRAREGGRDLNRCFRPPFAGREGALAAAMLDAVREAAPDVLVDLHNTTGHTPPYGVGPTSAPDRLELVSLFGERFVESDIALGALVEATDPELPSVTVECGRAGSPGADAVARAGLERLLSVEEWKGAPAGPVQVLRGPVRVQVRPGMRVAYGDAPDRGADLTVDREVDRHNFEVLDPDTPIGWLGGGDPWPVEARGADGRDVSRELFAAADGLLRVRHRLVPIMMTTDPAIAASDCLFYVTPLGRVADPSPARRRPVAGPDL